MRRRFIPGLDLAGRYYVQHVRLLLATEYPGLVYSAALIGWGSEVLGFDSARSTDHNWGLRLQVFLSDGADPALADQIGALLDRGLPERVAGYPVRFAQADVPGAEPQHWVTVTGLGEWLSAQLGFDPRRDVTLLDWLATPTQLLAEVTGGRVFHDGLAPAGLAAARSALAWYPDDVWRYVLACQWQRVSQEEAFPGRCAEAGDDLGSAVVAARLARDLIRLALLMHRQYPPYSKWLGSALARLPGAAALTEPLGEALAASTWPAREDGLSGAYRAVARMHDDLRLTAPVDGSTRSFYDRPYQVLGADRFAAALRATIADPRLRRLPLTGAVDQFIDSTEAAGSRPLLRAAIAALLA